MFQKYCVVFQELFVVFADVGHRTTEIAYFENILIFLHLGSAGSQLISLSPQHASLREV